MSMVTVVEGIPDLKADEGDTPDTYQYVRPAAPLTHIHQHHAAAVARMIYFERLICVCVFVSLIFFGIFVFVLLPKLVDDLPVCPVDYEISIIENCTQLQCCHNGRIKENLNCSLLHNR